MGTVFIDDGLWDEQNDFSRWFVALSHEAQRFYFYLNTTRRRQWCGAFFLPQEEMAKKLRIEKDRIAVLLAEVKTYVAYDVDTFEIFVSEHLFEQTRGGKISISQLGGIRRQLENITSENILKAFFARYPQLRPAARRGRPPTTGGSKNEQVTFDMLLGAEHLLADSLKYRQIIGHYLQIARPVIKTAEAFDRYIAVIEKDAMALAAVDMPQILGIMKFFQRKHEREGFKWSLPTILTYMNSPQKFSGAGDVEKPRDELLEKIKAKHTHGELNGQYKKLVDDYLSNGADQQTPEQRENFIQECIAGRHGPAAQRRCMKMRSNENAASESQGQQDLAVEAGAKTANGGKA